MDAQAAPVARPSTVRDALRRHESLLTLLALTALVFAVMAWWVPSGRFLRPANFEGLSYVAPELGLLAIATMVAMLTGGIDAGRNWPGWPCRGS